MTQRAGSRPAPVATASPTGSPSGNVVARSSRHSARIDGPPAAVDRPVDAAAAEQARVGGVHDRVDALGGDVARDEFDARHPLGYPRLLESSKMRSSSATAASR